MVVARTARAGSRRGAAAHVGGAALGGRVLWAVGQAPDDAVATAGRRAVAWARIHRADLWVAHVLPRAARGPRCPPTGRRWWSGCGAHLLERTGRFVDETIALVRDLGVSLVVLSAEDLSRGALCRITTQTGAAVLVARPPRGGAVLACTDLNVQHAPVLRAAAALSWLFEAPVATLHNVPLAAAVPALPSAVGAPPQPSVELARLVDYASRELERQQRGLFSAAPESVIVTRGNARQAILESAQARDADLIVVGMYPGSPLRRRILGGVATSVSMDADQSVLVVPIQREAP